jgi:hypothetical protein
MPLMRAHILPFTTGKESPDIGVALESGVYDHFFESEQPIN